MKAYEQYSPQTFNGCVYTGRQYMLSTPRCRKLDDLADQLGWRKEKVPVGANPVYINVENSANIQLVAGDIVYLNQWDRIDACCKGRTEYFVSET